MKHLIVALLLFTGVVHGQGLTNIDPDTKKYEYQGEWSYMPIWSMQDSLTAAALPFTGDSHFRIYTNEFLVKDCDVNHVSTSSPTYMPTVSASGVFGAVRTDSIQLTSHQVTTALGFVPASASTGYTLGSSTVSGTLLQTAYVITHGLSYTPSSVYIQPKSANAAALSWVTNITSTNFTITFLSVPILGTNNISFNWVAYK